MKVLKTFDDFINEQMIKIPLGEVRGGEIRINGLGNKVYFVNFEENTDPPERKKFIKHLKEKYGSIITDVRTHLGDLVVELSIYVNKQMADTFKQLLNDMFTARAETNMEKSDREDTEKEEDGQ